MRPIDLARYANVSTASVRFYESEGFLPPAGRQPSGHRNYGEQHLAALLASRTMMAGYGWIPARDIMRCVHQGEIDSALSLVDARHAANHQERQTVANTIAALSHSNASPDNRETRRPVTSRHHVRIGEAASSVGVSVPTIRFWEASGLIQSTRDTSSNFRVFGANELERLRLVATLRRADFGIDAIRRVVTALRDNDPTAALHEARKRETMLHAHTRRLVKATAALWNYLRDAGYT
jgi:DNA-binding transcriptional MerR regulator